MGLITRHFDVRETPLEGRARLFELVHQSGVTVLRAIAWAEPYGCENETPPEQMRFAFQRRANRLNIELSKPLGAKSYAALMLAGVNLEEATCNSK